MRTHYDTLKVSRDAPIEVIQAAYRSLARKYHPDRNGHSPDGEAMMKSINAAYEILSDPQKRAEHDRWIAQHLDRPSVSSSTDARQSAKVDRQPAPDLTRTFTALLLSLCYFTIAFWMLRQPGLRYLGILMLLASLIYFRPRSR